MPDWQQLSQSKRAKYFVLAFVVADAAGLYLVNQRLNQPWVAPQGAAPVPEMAEAELPRPAPDLLAPPPAFALEDTTDHALVARPIEFAPLAEEVEEIPVAAKEAPAVVLPAKVAVRSPARLDRAARRWQAPRDTDRGFASAFAGDVVTVPATNSALPEPAFGFAPSASVEAVQGEAVYDYPEPAPAQADVQAEGYPAAESAPVVEDRAPSELPAVEPASESGPLPG